ncbi:hypothetical protein KFE25_002497 [Diacronema lutheri]|uniref:gamma-glutamylcyclotransferase n=1 Tax=Diacronema lutheri TaxID=2081491 RepID=A0A8J5X9N4_DIALT|nr:hypothetical protein KFE25_002497 [Diacronema lutheri]
MGFHWLVHALLASLLSSVAQPPRLVPQPPSVRYFAYGANNDQQLMRRRIGSEPLAAEPAVAQGFRLAFTALGVPPEPGFASIEPAHGLSECHGVLYTLTFEQMARLCATEAVPVAYAVVSLKVRTYHGQSVGAATLRANGVGALLESMFGPIRPSERYLNIIRAGARESGLSEEWLTHLGALAHYGAPS